MELINFDVNRTLDELDGGANARGSMMSKSSKERKIPLKKLTTEQLRIMIVQNRSLKFLVPLAIERLLVDPLLKGDLYAGDLINAVLTIEKKFWGSDLNGYIPMLNSIIEKAEAIAQKDPKSYEGYMLHTQHAIKLFKTNTSSL